MKPPGYKSVFEISGFEMKMSKYKKLSVLLWRGLVKIEMV